MSYYLHALCDEHSATEEELLVTPSYVMANPKTPIYDLSKARSEVRSHLDDDFPFELKFARAYFKK